MKQRKEGMFRITELRKYAYIKADFEKHGVILSERQCFALRNLLLDYILNHRNHPRILKQYFVVSPYILLFCCLRNDVSTLKFEIENIAVRNIY